MNKFSSNFFACAAVVALVSSLSASVAWSADLEPSQLRDSAAARLFDIPLYRELTTRQIYQMLDSVPEPQRARGIAALRDPKVVQALRQAIIRSTATTFSLQEIEVVRKFLRADEARSIFGKLDQFRGALLQQAVAAVMTNPDLAPLLGGENR